MPAALVIQLLATFGPSAIALITQLINLYQSNGTVTAAQWATLTDQLKESAADHMKSQLTAAGIPLTDPHAVALLNLVS